MREALVINQEGLSWLWTASMVVVVAAGAILLAVIFHRQRSLRREWNHFDERCRKMDLREEEKKVLRHMVKVSGLKSPLAILSVEGAFDLSVNRLMQSSQVASMNEKLYSSLTSMLRTIREKLGFDAEISSNWEGVESTRSLSVGSRLFLASKGGNEVIEATLVETSEKTFTLALEQEVLAHPGDPFLVRYSGGSSIWEFDAPAVEVSPDRLLLEHVHKLRIINRRRFPRVPTRKPARIARFSTEEDLLHNGHIDFQEAVLTEIAGPGLVFSTSLPFHFGEKALVILEFSKEHIVQGMGKVRRAEKLAEDQWSIAVELLGLTPAEIAELARETNHAGSSLRAVAQEEQEASEHENKSQFATEVAGA
jgi:hypothetical protein